MRKVLAVAALAALLAASGVAHAQNSTVNSREVLNHTGAGRTTQTIMGGIRQGDSLWVPVTVSANGYMSVDDVNRDRDLVYQNLATLSTVLLFGNSDSTQAVSTRGWNHIGITFFPSFFDSVAGAFNAHPEYVVLGLTVQHHYVANVDTVSSFDWLRRNRSGQPAAGAAWADSFGTSISPGMLLPADSLIRRWEIPVVLHLQPIRRGEVIWLDDVATGAAWQSGFTSIAVRNVGVHGFTTNATGPVVLFSGQAGVGSALSRIQCGIALVGAR